MKQRIITGIIAAAIFIPIVYVGDFIFDLAMIALAVIGLSELFNMRKLKSISAEGFVAYLGLLLLVAPIYIFDSISFPFEKNDIIVIVGLLLLAVTVISKNKFSFDDVGFLMISLIYVSAGFSFMIMTREMGLALFLFPLFIIWATDSGAYFTGMNLGKNKLWPEISPNKTIEGFIGGIFFGLIISLGFYFFDFVDFSIMKTILLSILISVAGQFGDLVQSAFKRHYSIKDSGKILPGHGGILDRFDSLIYVMPLYFLILFFL